MKRIITFFSLLLLATFSFAQSGMIPVSNHSHKLVHRPASTQNHSRSPVTFVLDYDAAEYNIYGQDSSQYQALLWAMNSNFKATQGDSFLQAYFIVAYDSIFDYMTDTHYYGAAMNSINIDSVFVTCGWENNSALPDTIIVDIVQLNAAGFPATPYTILHSDTAITSIGATTNNDYGDFVGLQFAPNFNTTQDHFGVMVRFFGSKLDTFGFAAGFAKAGPCNTLPYSAIRSTFYPNSYSQWTNYASIAAVLPTSTGGDVYYDCNQNGQYDDGTDGVNFIQNIWTAAKVTIDYNVGINNQNTDVATSIVVPNPAKDLALLRFTLPSTNDVSVNVYDVTGKIVANYALGNLTDGSHDVKMNIKDFSAGVYMYSIETSNGKTFGKFVVSK